MFIRTGPEIGVAAIKTFVSQVATATLLTVHFGHARGSLSIDETESLIDALRAFPGAVQQVLDQNAAVEEAAGE